MFLCSASKLETQLRPQDWKRSIFSPISEKGDAKECSHCRTAVLILHASTVMLKVLQARLQQYMTENFQMDQLGLKKAEEAESKLPTFREPKRKQGDSRKASASASFTMLKPLCGSQRTVENSSRDGNTRPPYPPPKKPVCGPRSNS